jgi:excisionase family DNA binding protein
LQDQLLTLYEAATRLGVHVATLRQWVRDGRIPAYRLGQRFTRVSWDEVLQALATERAHVSTSEGGKESD